MKKDYWNNLVLQEGTLVRVFKNLTRNTWSIQIKTPKGWRVTGHSYKVKLKNARTVVSEKVRERVIKEKKKYVHAFIEGEWCGRWGDQNINPGALYHTHTEVITYNPFKSKRFFTRKNYGVKTVSPDWRGHVWMTKNYYNELKVWKEVA